MQTAPLQTEIPQNELVALLQRQLNSFWGVDIDELKALQCVLPAALERLSCCLAAVGNKYCMRDGEVFFSPFHSEIYCMYLYHLSNELGKTYPKHVRLAEKIYYLNKVMHGVDIYYQVNLPSIFWIGHSLGTIIGRAELGSYFSFSQGCNVGNNRGCYPRLGHHVHLFPRSVILGDSLIGNYCVLSTGAVVKDQVVPDYSLVFGVSPNLVFKPITKEKYFNLAPFNYKKS